jgi:hypothetical protein
MTTWTIVNMERDPMSMVTTQALPTAHWACLVN